MICGHLAPKCSHPIRQRWEMETRCRENAEGSVILPEAVSLVLFYKNFIEV